jgi:phage-related protein
VVVADSALLEIIKEFKMVALILTNKIKAQTPVRSAKLRTERMQTDNYSIRAASGFNNIEVVYQLSWTKLTPAEAQSLSNLFDTTAGVSLIQWTPPMENSERNFTVESYDIQLLEDSGAEYTYTANAKLIQEYDL